MYVWLYDLKSVLRLRNVFQPTHHQTTTKGSLKSKWQSYQFKLIRRCLFFPGTHLKQALDRERWLEKALEKETGHIEGGTIYLSAPRCLFIVFLSHFNCLLCQNLHHSEWHTEEKSRRNLEKKESNHSSSNYSSKCHQRHSSIWKDIKIYHIHFVTLSVVIKASYANFRHST